MKKQLITFLIIILLTVMHQMSKVEEKIKEEIKVKWLVVPFYAVDQQDQAIGNLKIEDIELYLNNRRIEDFIIYRKGLLIKEITSKERIIPRQFPKPVKKIVFLVFDAMLTEPLVLAKSKVIGQKIVSESDENSYYILMSLESNKGLKYHVGPSNDKQFMMQSIKKKIKMRGGKKTRYNTGSLDPNDISYSPGWESVATAQIKRSREEGLKKVESKYFITSLYTLNTALKTFKENGKIVFIFSSGISKGSMFIRRNIKLSSLREGAGQLTPDSFMFSFLRDVAQTFNRNGSMLFLINLAGTRRFKSLAPDTNIPSEDWNSGEMSLRYLARASGGRYFEGTNNMISKIITEFNRAYYELAFPYPTTVKGEAYNFDIKVKKPGIKVYSLKKIYMGKNYEELNNVERELLILNALEGGYWAKSQFSIEQAKLNKVKKDKHSIHYRLNLPGKFSPAHSDIYQVWKNEKKNDVKLKKLGQVLTSRGFEIGIKKIKGYIHYLVIIEKELKIALIAR